jgi:hypothetical protein
MMLSGFERAYLLVRSFMCSVVLVVLLASVSIESHTEVFVMERAELLGCAACVRRQRRQDPAESFPDFV